MNFDEKKVNEHIGIYYLLTEIQLYTFNFFKIEYIPQEGLDQIRR